MPEEIMDDEFSIDETQQPVKKPIKIIKETAKYTEEANAPRAKATTEAAQIMRLDMAQKKLVQVYKNEPTVAVRVAPSYAKYFGKVMRVSINGISIAIRCDGSTVNLPESYAAEVNRRMSKMDEYETKAEKLGQVSDNHEHSPGEINFFY